MSTLTFLGAAGTVTGSRYLLEYDGRRVMIDCGLFQGPKALRQRNWAPSPVDPRHVDALVLTHAHIDHTGGLPRFVKEGYRGPVYATSGTRDLCGLMLPDSAHLQEEEARYANKAGYSKHRPALPLYTADDAQRALRLFETLAYDRPREILPGITLRFVHSGHILGAAICVFELEKTGQRVVFTGDLGRYDAPILRDPEPVARATTLIAESTYGDRTHGEAHPREALAKAVNDTVARGGVVVIPAFAVGRTQEVLFHLGRLEAEGLIPELPVYVDSPMACDATPMYLAHRADHDEEMRALFAHGDSPLSTRQTHFVTSVQASKALNTLEGPVIILSASGMATGGRVLHHLAHRLADAKNTVLFVGYQAEGTRGRRLVEGEATVKLHGQLVPVKAQVVQVSGFSAHADWREMLRWMEGFDSPPRQTLLVHGEPPALASLQQKVAARGWAVAVPQHHETITLATA